MNIEEPTETTKLAKHGNANEQQDEEPHKLSLGRPAIYGSGVLLLGLIVTLFALPGNGGAPTLKSHPGGLSSKQVSLLGASSGATLKESSDPAGLSSEQIPLLGASSPIIRKWSDQTYPGFEEIKNYIESCGVLDYENHRVGIYDGRLAFLDSSSRAQAGMENVMNFPKFKFFYSLLPAGTDPVTAFCQLMVLRYRSQLGLTHESGTYLIRFSVWRRIFTAKNEAQLSQEVTFSYSATDKGDFNTIVCL